MAAPSKLPFDSITVAQNVTFLLEFSNSCATYPNHLYCGIYIGGIAGAATFGFDGSFHQHRWFMNQICLPFSSGIL